MTDNSDRDVNGEQRHNYVFVHLICQILNSCSVSLLNPHNVSLFTSMLVFSFYLQSNEWI